MPDESKAPSYNAEGATRFLSKAQGSYWTQSKGEIFKLFQTGGKGLSQAEASERLKRWGPNELTKRKRYATILLFFSKFSSPLILILLAASLISAFLGEITNFIIIATIVAASGIIDFFQEYHAENAARKLARRVATTATVMRNGQKQEILLGNIVPGDIILLSVGDLVPADARLVESRDLLVDQSTITGESYPQEKNAESLNSGSAAVQERTNCVFMGTNVISGEGTAVVVATGANSEFGKVAKEVVKARPETEFSVGAKNFGLLLVKVTFALVLFVFIINSIFLRDPLTSFIFALALAVGLTPELLPLIITTNLSRGALRMAKKGVIVKYLPAIQNFGSMNILCTDKTGTLTENKIILERYENVRGQEDNEVLRIGYLTSTYQTGIKSPLEAAVLAHGKVDVSDFKKIDEIPFDFIRKRLSVVVEKQGQRLLVTKGAPEFLLPLCKWVEDNGKKHDLTKELTAKITERFEKLSAEGFRVLAVAEVEVDKKQSYQAKDEKNLSFLGLMAFLDPPKEGATEALQHLKSQGIELKILTGDNETVTRKVCNDLGLEIKGSVNGESLDRTSDEELSNLAAKTTIFARLAPEQKERVITALKKRGAVVGYLGDGINDAPSLRAADIGISVNNAVDVAKESADLILLRKDLQVLKDGVSEGRRTYANIMKYIMMGTSSNFGNMFSVAGGSIFLPFLPMLPVQILLNNLLYDFSELTIPSDKVDSKYLEKPRKWDISGIRRFMLVFGPISSLFDFLTFFLLLLLFHASASFFQTGWFIESLATQTLIIFAIRTRTVPFFKSKPGIMLAIASISVAAFGLIVPFIPFTQRFFSFVTPPVAFYLVLPLIIGAYFLLVELTKRRFYQRYEV